MKYIFVVNGRADKAAYRERLIGQIEQCARNVSYEIYETEGMGDATRFTHVYCDLHPVEEVCFVACGGDGTINEVASGIVGFEHKSLAIITGGSNGNDFIKYYPERCFTDIKAMLDGETAAIDILKINDSYSINVCNFGFDSVVGHTANEMIFKGKSNPYRRGIFRAILIGRFNRIDVWADGEKLGRKRMLLCTLANNRYVGGEFLCAPRAKNDDGLIEVCYLKPMTLLRFLLLLPLYAKGKHLESNYFRKKIIYRQAKTLKITSPDLIELCLDGEILPGGTFNIEILPKAIPLRLPKIQQS